MLRILVIKLGALGDVVQSLGAMRAIRAHHPDAHITVLTTKPFQGLLEKSGLFNAIHLDSKPKWFEPRAWLGLIRFFNEGRFDRVYDLQNNDRTFFYLRLFLKRPEWVGAAPGASHRNASDERTAGHAFYGHVQTLKLAGIEPVEIDTLDWLDSDLSALNLPADYAVLVPGSAPQHPGKRWPHFPALAQQLIASNVIPVVIGTKDEQDAIDGILAAAPQAISLVGQTKLWDLPSLARQANCVIGNDTGPMHIMAPSGTRTVVIMGPKSNPKRHYPLGKNVTILHDETLSAIGPDQVLAALAKRT